MSKQYANSQCQFTCIQRQSSASSVGFKSSFNLYFSINQYLSLVDLRGDINTEQKFHLDSP